MPHDSVKISQDSQTIEQQSAAGTTKTKPLWFKVAKTKQELEEDEEINRQLTDEETVSESKVENTLYNGQKEYIHFTEMIDGESFGEISLFDENQQRVCKVTTLKHTVCLVVDTMALRHMNTVYNARMIAEVL